MNHFLSLRLERHFQRSTYRVPPPLWRIPISVLSGNSWSRRWRARASGCRCDQCPTELLPPAPSPPMAGSRPAAPAAPTPTQEAAASWVVAREQTVRGGGKQRARAGWGGKLSGPKLRNRVHSENGRSSYKNFFLRFRSMVQLQGGGQWRCSSRNVSAMLGDDGGFNPVWWAGSEDWRSGFCAAPLWYSFYCWTWERRKKKHQYYIKDAFADWHTFTPRPFRLTASIIYVDCLVYDRSSKLICYVNKWCFGDLYRLQTIDCEREQSALWSSN